MAKLNEHFINYKYYNLKLQITIFKNTDFKIRKREKKANMSVHDSLFRVHILFKKGQNGFVKEKTSCTYRKGLFWSKEACFLRA